MLREETTVVTLARKYILLKDDAALRVAAEIYKLTHYPLPGIKPEFGDDEDDDEGYDQADSETGTFKLPLGFSTKRRSFPTATRAPEGRPLLSPFRRRNRPGTKRADVDQWKMAGTVHGPGRSALTSSSLREHLGALIHADPSNVNRICQLPPGSDATRWQFEHMRRFVMELNELVIALREAPAASRCCVARCPTMCAGSKYTFRCADRFNHAFECSAMEYMTHTLDLFAMTLCSKRFPVNDRAVVSQHSLDPCRALARRAYRVFPHAYFHHRNIFNAFESKQHLCKRFMKFVALFKVVQTNKLIPQIRF